MIFALTFLNMAALDLCWVGYNRSTGQARKVAGVLWAMVLAGLSGVNAIAVTEDHWNLLATVLGAGAGTWVGLVVLPRFERTRKATARPVDPSMALELACTDARAEVLRAKGIWGDAPFHSAHEGFAVAREEVDELWKHVMTNQKRRDLDAMRTEAIQSAAMFLRFASECCDEESGRV